MAPTVQLMPSAMPNATLLLPAWRPKKPDGTYAILTEISTLTFTIERIDAGTPTVGAAGRDGKNAGGCVVAADGTVKHTVSATDNAPETAGEHERRRVTYTIVLTSSAGTVIHAVDYWLRAAVPVAGE